MTPALLRNQLRPALRRFRRYDFPQWKFSVYFLAIEPHDFVAPPVCHLRCIESLSLRRCDPLGGHGRVRAVSKQHDWFDHRANPQPRLGIGRHAAGTRLRVRSQFSVPQVSRVCTWQVWNGNTGADAGADSPLYAAVPKARGFGHIAVNVDDVEAFCAQLEANGCRCRDRTQACTLARLCSPLLCAIVQTADSRRSRTKVG